MWLKKSCMPRQGEAEQNPWSSGRSHGERIIHGDRDLDVFLLFDPGLSREQLEEEGLRLARHIADELSDGYFEKYAEHPYINATIEGFDVDLVPCFRVASAAAIRSSVDRTPFHTRYIGSKIASLVDDVLLLKQFAKAGGVYGSDQMTEGFSGYLCELLILHSTGFSALLEAAAAWNPGTLIDLEAHRTKDFSEPLVVIDPVDPGRNVSASVSLDQMYAFVELARGYLDSPSRLFFFPPAQSAYTREELDLPSRFQGHRSLRDNLCHPPLHPRCGCAAAPEKPGRSPGAFGEERVYCKQRRLRDD